MIIRTNGTRYKYYKKWNKSEFTPYDYENNGIVNRIMSKVIVNNTNPITNIILQFFDKSIIFVLKYTDVLKNFKNIHWKNR